VNLYVVIKVLSFDMATNLRIQDTSTGARSDGEYLAANGTRFASSVTFLMAMAQSDPLDNLIISRRLTVSLREESRDSRSIPCNKIGDVRVGQYQSRLSIERIE